MPRERISVVILLSLTECSSQPAGRTLAMSYYTHRCYTTLQLLLSSGRIQQTKDVYSPTRNSSQTTRCTLRSPLLALHGYVEPSRTSSPVWPPASALSHPAFKDHEAIITPKHTSRCSEGFKSTIRPRVNEIKHSIRYCLQMNTAISSQLYGRLYGHCTIIGRTISTCSRSHRNTRGPPTVHLIP